MKKKLIIEVQGSPVRIEQTKHGEYICITDIAKTSKDGNATDIIKNYLRNRSNLEFLGLWEQHYNPDFKTVDSDRFRDLASSHSFTLSVKKWIEGTNAIGIRSVSGRYGGTYAHRDIAIHFTTYFSSESYFYLIKEFQRLKETEQSLLNNTLKFSLDKIIDGANRVRIMAEGGIDMITGEEE
ncbi:MAG: hypothetical protein ACI85O_003747 [Saprospiraceae bacterium]|jgi:hypothetical protein